MQWNLKVLKGPKRDFSSCNSKPCYKCDREGNGSLALVCPGRHCPCNSDPAGPGWGPAVCILRNSDTEFLSKLELCSGDAIINQEDILGLL